MTAEGNPGDSSEDMLHMFPVIGSFRHDIFPRWIEGRGMNVEDFFLHHVAGHRSLGAGFRTSRCCRSIRGMRTARFT